MIRALSEEGRRSETDIHTDDSSPRILLKIEVSAYELESKDGKDPYTLYELRVMLTNPRNGRLMTSRLTNPERYTTLEALTEAMEDRVSQWTTISHPMLISNAGRAILDDF